LTVIMSIHAGKHTLIIYTRYPEQGKVKTRLIPVLGEQGALSLHRDMSLSILNTARRLASTDDINVEIHFEGGSVEDMRSVFGNGFLYIPQNGKNLGDRMLASFTRCLNSGSEKVVLIGADCPGITGSIIRQAFAFLQEKDCVIGPSTDGGYYLMGLARPMPELFTSIPWGTGAVLSHTLKTAEKSGLEIARLRELTDIDRPEDLHVWERKLRSEEKPMISVVIPALNESNRIGKTVIRAQHGDNVEVIVVDGGSNDRTRKIAAHSGARIFVTGSGRAVQMNAGAGKALGEILLFLHADTLLPEGYDDEVRAALSRKDTVAGAFRLSFDEDLVPLRLIAAGANARTRYLKMPFGDQAIFLRKDTFLDSGGFPEVPIMEDVMFVRDLRSKGSIAVISSPVVTSSRRFLDLGPFRTWMLNQLSMAAFRLQVPLGDLAALYRGRETSLRIWLPHLVSAMKTREKGRGITDE
jgi:hypothetical protein